MRLRIYFVILFLGALASCKEKGPEKPNIIFIMMDDLGYGQCGLYSKGLELKDLDPDLLHQVTSTNVYDPAQAITHAKQAMPILGTLAKEGVVFTRAFSSSSLCAPSRLGIATGKMPARFGVYINVDCEAKGIPPGMHLATRIKAEGYATAHIGKWHIGRRDYQMIQQALARRGIHDSLSYGKVKKLYPEIYNSLHDGGYYGSVVPTQNPLQNGFDYYFGYNNWASQFYHSTLVWKNYEHAGRQQGYNTDVFTDSAMAFMQRQVDERHPFYVQLHYHAVHDSLQPLAPKKYFQGFQTGNLVLDNFYAHVNAVDQNIGRLVDFLKATGQYENTIIVFTADNGAQAGGPSVLPANAPFKGQKGSYFQGGMRVPLLVHWPAKCKQKKVSDMLVSTMDILPTLVESAGANLPDSLDGKSLLPYLCDTSAAPLHDHLVWAGIHARSWGFMKEKVLKIHGSERLRAPPAWVVVKGDYMLRFVGKVEPNLYPEVPGGHAATLRLFNINTDPSEKSDVSVEFPGKVDELSGIFKQSKKVFRPPVTWRKSKWQELIKSRIN